MSDRKDARMSIRLSKGDKRQFYKLCDQFGLCPSKIVERWIHRFNLNARRKEVPHFNEIVRSASDEKWEEYNEYKSSSIE